MSLYHDKVSRSTRKKLSEEGQYNLYPEQRPLIPDAFPNHLFSCIYKESNVSCVQQLNGKAPPVADTTDEAENPNVVLHAEARLPVILPHPRWRKQGCVMDARQAKGFALAANAEIVREGNVWIVPSETSSKKYIADLFLQTCTCPDFEKNKVKCKHLHAVDYLVRKESNLPLPAPVKTKRPTYRQQWHQYNLSQTREKSYFKGLLYELCATIIEPEKPKGRGRPPAPLSDLIYASGVKTYNCLSGRRNQDDLDEALQRGYLSRPVRYNTVFKYLELDVMTPYLQQLITQSSLPLKTIEVDFAVDSSGFSTCQYVRWFDVKYGNTEDWHDWIKLHLMTGVRTNIVTSCEVSRRYANDSPYFKPLVNATAANGFRLREVSGDKAYSSYSNLRLVEKHGGTPYVAFKENANGNSKCQVWNRMYHDFCLNQEEYMRHYHKRSNSESTFSMIKARFGERLRSKTERAQINEALLKVLSHNLCVVIQAIHELGINVEFGMENGTGF